MAGQVVDDGKGLSAIRRRVMWGLVAFAFLWLLYLTASRIDHAISRWPSTVREAASITHCIEFIALAKAKYGAVWKDRLDPRDKTCAIEIQQEWEQQTVPRTTPAEPSLRASSESPAPSSAVDPSVFAASGAAAPPAADTFCLNVISLAQAKYGADWRTRLSTTDAVACAGPLDRAGQ